MPLNLDYYYGNEAEQYSFYRIPKVLFTDRRFRSVSVEAKVLYGLLLDRMSLSVKNGWMDGDGRVYIIFTIADVMETLVCAEQKANKLLNELDAAKGIGLIERKRRGLGKPNVIYVKNFLAKPPFPPGDRDEPESQIQNCENHKSGNVKITIQELRKSQTNNTDSNHTERSETDLSIHPQAWTDGAGQMDGIGKTDLFYAYRALIRENISYGILLERYPYDRERLDGFVELMAEVCSSSRETVRVNQDEIGTEIVKGRLLKLDSSHIEYVMDCLDKNTTPVGNVRAYILSALFNAPVTISQYYASLVRNDMAEGFGGG
ncbi:MAG: replication initiator protein A [Roseburia sp.]|nr:replication initiator protein A [Roseburia sp.]MCM1096746.1 replication initiator protein A [Ruminococcus flavefaciens]MCM1222774.1 replication initiator protein A [Lachnospiraceae bacterium]